MRENTAYLSIIYKHSISTPHPVNRCIHRFFFSVPCRFGASLHLHENHLRERQHEVLWHKALKGSREGCQIGIFQLFQFCEAFLWISFSIHAGYPSVGPQWVKGSAGQKFPANLLNMRKKGDTTRYCSDSCFQPNIWRCLLVNYNTAIEYGHFQKETYL